MIRSKKHFIHKNEVLFCMYISAVGNFLVFYITRMSDYTVHVLRVMYGGRNVKDSE